jgi:hypothetical protein
MPLKWRFLSTAANGEFAPLAEVRAACRLEEMLTSGRRRGFLARRRGAR